MSAQAIRPPAQLPPQPSPVAPAERVEILDILRGFALFGILLINITAFKAPGAPPGLGYEGPLADRLVLAGLIVFVESKFFTLFSFLFGLGFAVQLLRAQQRGVPFVPRFARRLVALAGFGVAHIVLLWEGDILLLYALVGSLLLAFRNATPRTLRRWASGLLLLPTALFAVALGGIELARRVPESAAALQQADREFAALFAEAKSEAIQLFGSGTYSEILAKRLASYGETAALLATRIPSVLAMFLLGLYVGRLGIAQRAGDHLPLLRRVRFWGLVLGLPASLLVAFAYTNLHPISSIVALFFNQTLAGPLLSLGYAATLTLLAQRPTWQRLLRPLAAPGQMALTNYLSQSLICAMLFYGYGFGLAGRVAPTVALALAVAIYALQAGLSAWWLQRFRFGPLEWLWRSLTYGRWQPLWQAVPDAR